LNFENSRGKFPEGATGWNSAETDWVGHTGSFLILPYLEQEAIHDEIDYEERMQDFPNTGITAKQIFTYQCPSDNARGRVIGSPSSGFSRSNYALFYGPEFVYPPGVRMPQDQSTRHGRPDDELENGGPFRHELSRKMRNFFDGTSNTVMVSELLSGQVDKFGRVIFGATGLMHSSAASTCTIKRPIPVPRTSYALSFAALRIPDSMTHIPARW